MRINPINNYYNTRRQQPSFQAQLEVESSLYSHLNELGKGLEFRFALQFIERALEKEDPNDIVTLSVLPESEAKKVYVGVERNYNPRYPKAIRVDKEDVKITINGEKSCGFYLNETCDEQRIAKDFMKTYHYIKGK